MTSTPIEGASANLAELFLDAISKFSDSIAFKQDRSEWSYNEVDEIARPFSAALRARYGLAKGDRVAIMMPNSIEFITASIAVIWAGAVIVNVNPFYTKRELSHQLNDAGVEMIIIGLASVPTLSAALPETKIKTVIFSSDAKNKVDLDRYSGVETINYYDVVSAGANSELYPVQCQPDDIAVLQYTGGTTGVSKGAILRHRNITSNSQQIKMALTPPLQLGEEIVLTALPLYHIFAFTVNFVTFFSLGATNVLIANPSDVDGIVKEMCASKITAMTGVNTLYANIIESDAATNIDWSNFKVAIGGGSAILPVTSAKWKALTGAHILEGYGMTETSPVLTVVPVGVEAFTSTVGIPLPHTEIKIFDDDDNVLPTSEIGEICIRGPQVMSGYWNREDLQDSVFNTYGFLKTGDLGFFDDRGYIKIVDRKKDLILVSGFNVYPNEVEVIASSYPLITECACIGVPHETTGEVVKLFIVTPDAQNFDIKALQRHCRAELAAYKVPKQVEIVGALPKSPVGKILRRELKGIELVKQNNKSV